jgi:hypothetical protein
MELRPGLVRYHTSEAGEARMFPSVVTGDKKFAKHLRRLTPRSTYAENLPFSSSIAAMSSPMLLV